MTAEAQNVEIAEACGELDHERTFNRDGAECVHCGIGWSNRGKSTCTRRPTKNYCGDLNAMFAVQESIGKDWYLYETELRKVTFRDAKEDTGLCDRLIRAAAAQRAEAFLRTIGRWKD